jgi:hypothetical protein
LLVLRFTFTVCGILTLPSALPCPALPCPALLCSALPCPALPCFALQVDGKLRRIAQHGTPRVRKAMRGDSIAMLAVRERAFAVGTLMFARCAACDALALNAEGETLKDVLREYNIIAADNMQALNADVARAMKGILLPSTAEGYVSMADKLMNEQINLQKMLLLVVENLRRRVALIEKQKWEHKKATLRKQVRFVTPYQLSSPHLG